jgi:TolA-binding protein
VKFDRARSLFLALLLCLLAIGVATQDAEAQTRRRTGQQQMKVQRTQIALPPDAKRAQPAPQRKDLRAVKPPSSRKFYGSRGTLEERYEQLVDAEIAQLYKLSQQYQRSPSRGEIWVRLAERYVEKSRLIEFRLQDEFDKKLEAYNAGKTKVKPKLDLGLSNEYSKKAIQLYLWFIRDFPKDPKMDQALYFLGYSHFDIGDLKRGEAYYNRLIKEYPRSEYVAESHFALGEYHFENENWQEALNHYSKVIQREASRLYTFALYKASWCFFRLGRTATAIKSLERVIYVSRSSGRDDGDDSTRSVNTLRLAAEALKDYVPFYFETEDYENAERAFLKVSGKQSMALSMLEQLAYMYAFAGDWRATEYLFQRLIRENPRDPKAAQYQYQIVQVFTDSKNEQGLRGAYTTWISQFGPDSPWAKANAGNKQLLADTFKLQESTLRRRTLQLHQNAQNTRHKSVQAEAKNSYDLYMQNFSSAADAPMMRFFLGELLFDMQDYKGAAQNYTWYLRNVGNGPYTEKAAINNVLALEKLLPTPETLEARREKLPKKTDVLPMDEVTTAFVAAARMFLDKFPKAEQAVEVRRRLAVVLYNHNEFDQALAEFNAIVDRPTWDENSKISAELILDIHNLREDIPGYERDAARFLSRREISDSEFGKNVRVNLQKATLMSADKMSQTGKYIESAKTFENFAKANQKTAAGQVAAYNAANNYQKGLDFVSASKMYLAFLSMPAADQNVAKLKEESRNNLAEIYRRLGRLSEAADQYYAFSKETTNSAKSMAALYNASLIWKAGREDSKAKRALEEYAGKARGNDKAEAIFHLAEIEGYNGRTAAERALYERYLSSAPTDTAKVMLAHYRIFKSHAASGRGANSTEWAKRTVSTYENLKKQGRAVGVRYAAEARYFLSSEKLEEMDRVQLGQTEASITKGLERLQGLQQGLLQDMVVVVKMDYGPYIIAGIISEAQALEKIAAAFEKAPVPKEYASSPEASAQFRELARNEAKGFRDRAKAIYEDAYKRAMTLDVVSPYTIAAMDGVQRYSPDKMFYRGEVITGEYSLDGGGL